MSIKVCKFGGSSLASAERFRKVKAVVEADAERRYIVASAPGKWGDFTRKITDLLILCHEHAEQKLSFDEVWAPIRSRYLGIISELGLDLDLKSDLEGVRSAIAGGASLDFSASRGEYLNARLLASYLGIAFVEYLKLSDLDRHLFAISAALLPLVLRNDCLVVNIREGCVELGVPAKAVEHVDII